MCLGNGKDKQLQERALLYGLEVLYGYSCSTSFTVSELGALEPGATLAEKLAFILALFARRTGILCEADPLHSLYVYTVSVRLLFEGGKVRKQDLYMPFLAVSGTAEGQETGWRFLQKQMDRLLELYGAANDNILQAIVKVRFPQECEGFTYYERLAQGALRMSAWLDARMRGLNVL